MRRSVLRSIVSRSVTEELPPPTNMGAKRISELVHEEPYDRIHFEMSGGVRSPGSASRRSIERSRVRRLALHSEFAGLPADTEMLHDEGCNSVDC
jgi:hypothetical protein